MVERLGLDTAEHDAYFELVEILNDCSPCHQLLGYPRQIQGDMMLESQLASNGIYWTATMGLP
jgi:hypothetical protein